MSEFNIEDLDAVIAGADSSLVQMLALQLKKQIGISKASEQQLAAVVAENAVLKDDYRDTPALRRMGWPKTPATDAYLAEVRAQGVEMYAATLDRGADDAERDGFEDGMKFLRAEAEAVRKFASQLRQAQSDEETKC